jgi:excisionase family DNA binding protein
MAIEARDPALEERLERLYTAEEIADRFRISRTKVYELMKSGELRSVRIGGSRRIPETAAGAFLAGLQGS